MALIGTGFRTVNSVLCEMSFHLCQPIVYTTLALPITGSHAPQTATVASTNALYPGAQVIADSGAPTEIVTVVSAPTPTTFTAVFLNSHAAGIVIQGATFPLQALTDPIFTASEVVSYIARAQSEFLSAVPCVFQFAPLQTVSIGQILQPTPPATIQIARVSSSKLSIVISTLTRLGGTVTAVSPAPHGLTVGQKFSIINAWRVFQLKTSPDFDGAFQVLTTPTPTTWTYTQTGTDNVAAGGGTAVLWKRLYQVSQVELGCQNPQWRSVHVTELRSWFEDRTGLYRFGVNGIPATDFPINILSAIRDTDTLALTDGLVVPDLFVHYVKYGALAYAWSKDGVQASPLLAKYAQMRFSRGMMAAARWMSGMGLTEGMNAESSGGGGGGGRGAGAGQ